MRLCALGLVSLGLVSSAHAQSFNCRYARTPDEVAICQNGRLSDLDERLSNRQGNRANRLCCDEAGEVVVVPCGHLSPAALHG